MAQRIDRIIKFFETDIWRINQNNVSPLRFLFLEILKKLILAIRFFTTKRVLQKASALTSDTSKLGSGCGKPSTSAESTLRTMPAVSPTSSTS